MSRLSYVVSVEKEPLRQSDVRSSWIFSWFHVVNISNTVVLLFIFVKIYKTLLYFYQWIAGISRHKSFVRHKTILVLGTSNEVNKELLKNLSSVYKTECVVNLDNEEVTPCCNSNETKILYSFTNKPIIKQEKIYKLSKYVLTEFGSVDLLIISYSGLDTCENNGKTDKFFSQLNTQLLSQFWAVMAFLPSMMERNKGHIVSVALDRITNLGNLGVIRTIYEDVLQSDKNVKFTIVENNKFIDKYLPQISDRRKAKLIVRTLTSKSDSILLPTFQYYFTLLPLSLLGGQIIRVHRLFDWKRRPVIS